MKCNNCGAETQGTSVMHPMLTPPQKFHDLCEKCVNEALAQVDWSIGNFF